jgi:cell division protease FtsH
VNGLIDTDSWGVDAGMSEPAGGQCNRSCAVVPALLREQGKGKALEDPMSEQQNDVSGSSGKRKSESAGKSPRQQALRAQLRSKRFWLLIAALALANWFLVSTLFPSSSDRVTISYTAFREQVEAGNVTRITSHKDDIQGEFSEQIADADASGDASNRTYAEFQTTLPSFLDASTLEPFLIANDVIIDAEPLEQPRSLMATLLLGFGPTILLIGGFLWFSGKALGGAGGGILRLGRSRATRYDAAVAGHTPITFADVAGIDEVEAELVEVVDFLKNPTKYQRLGGIIPRGVLLIGPPGTGKTLLARAVAGEAHVPFFSMSGSEFIEMVVGVGASRVRDLFKQAREAAPAIIFIDELDAIGRKRGSTPVGGSDEREQTLNQILVEMDGFAARESIIVIAATNRADVLDPALLRPGRFDRRVTVLPPDKNGRAAILAVHTRGVPLAPGVDLDAVASESAGLVGAEIRNLVNEAALTAARRGRDSVSQTDFTDALEKIALGAERRLAMSQEDRERVAYHEAGHALIGLLQPDSDPVRRVTVVPRGGALGVTLSVPEADRYNYNEAHIRARLVSTLGGRAAEQIVYGSITTGAENDIKQVTDLARAMVTRWGMSPEVGLLAIDARESGDFLNTGAVPGTNAFSEETARRVDEAIRRIIDESYATAIELLTHNRHRLESLTEALLREESLSLDQMLEATGLSHERFTEQAPLAIAMDDD